MHPKFDTTGRLPSPYRGVARFLSYHVREHHVLALLAPLTTESCPVKEEEEEDEGKDEEVDEEE